MNAGTVPWSCSAAPVGRLLALLVAAAFLLAAVTGNSFSLHVGMTANASDVAVAVDHVSDVAAGTSGTFEVLPKESTDTAPMSVGSDVQHLMHLIGACLAVLAATVLLMRLLFLRRAFETGYPAVAALPRLVTPTPGALWSPPAPAPPTSSPVIRT